MNESIYTIILDDGTTITNLRMNGNNFTSDQEIEPTIFSGRLSRVVIIHGDIEEEHGPMRLFQTDEMKKENRFVLLDIPEEKIIQEQIRADIDYIAMMTGVEF